MVRGMPPLEALGPSIAIGLILFVMLWFALGTQRNVSKGNKLLRWLQHGLPIVGRRTTMRWLGSSAIQLEIVEPHAPFREATVVVIGIHPFVMGTPAGAAAMRRVLESFKKMKPVWVTDVEAVLKAAGEAL